MLEAHTTGVSLAQVQHLSWGVDAVSDHQVTSKNRPSVRDIFRRCTTRDDHMSYLFSANERCGLLAE